MNSEINSSWPLSAAYQREASRVIAGGVNSNVRMLQSPLLCFERAYGSHIIDVDGNDYIDYALGMGPAILGHSPEPLFTAIAESLAAGQLYAGQSNLELALAQRLRKYVPNAELVRIGTTGTEMVQTALRVGRAFTGRDKIVKFDGHYHGWLDNILATGVTFSSAIKSDEVSPKQQTRGQSRGALADTVVLPWNNLAEFQAYVATFGSETAAVIMEPALCNTGVIPPAPGYLDGVRQLCTAHGIVFIIDEVITGFRLGLNGAQGLFNVSGDLSIFAKALGGGFPIAALTGRQEMMSLIGTGAVNNSGTYNSNVLAVSAAIATIDTLAAAQGELYSKIEAIGQQLIDGMREIAESAGENLIVQGYPSAFNTSFGDIRSIGSVDDYRGCDESRQKRFIRALLERGVRPMARGTWFVSAAHTESDVETTLKSIGPALDASR